MIDEDRYYIDILTQIGTVRTVLASGDAKTAQAKSTELLTAVQRFAKMT